jgi:hypothetical protein
MQWRAAADQGSSLSAEWRISGIPRFALLDAEGNIVLADAPSPSQTSLQAFLTQLCDIR